MELRFSSSLANHLTDLFLRPFVRDGALLGVPQEKEKTSHGEVKAYITHKNVMKKLSEALSMARGRCHISVLY